MLSLILVIFFIVVLIFVFLMTSKSKKEVKIERDNDRLLNNNALASVPDFTATRKYFGHKNSYFIAIDEEREKIAFIIHYRVYKIIDFADVLSCEIIEDGEVISRKSTSRTISGAIIGGVLAGGTGAIIGGLSGNSREKKEVSSLDLKILIKDISNPRILIRCFDAVRLTVFKDKIETDDGYYGPLYKQIYNDVNRVKDTFSVIIDKIDSKGKIHTNLGTSSVSDELIKLNELKEKGILTEQEFQIQKQKVLTN